MHNFRNVEFRLAAARTLTYILSHTHTHRHTHTHTHAHTYIYIILYISSSLINFHNQTVTLVHPYIRIYKRTYSHTLVLHAHTHNTHPLTTHLHTIDAHNPQRWHTPRPCTFLVCCPQHNCSKRSDCHVWRCVTPHKQACCAAPSK